MNIKALCIFLLILIIPLVSMGQRKGKMRSFDKRQSSENLLLEAEKLKEAQPLEAVAIIEGVIANERKKKQISNLLGQAYFLLGNIYEQIGQDELAEQRYHEAITFISNKGDSLSPEIYYRLGVINLQRRNEKKAFINFNLCIKSSTNDEMKLRCEEGMADIKIMMNDNDAAISDLELLKEKYDLDSISLAKIEARKSQAFTQKKEFVNASNALQNSYNTLPKNADLLDVDLKELDDANDAFYSSSEISNLDKIATQNSIDYSEINDDNLVRENLRKSKLFEEEKELEEATISLVKSKDLITSNTAPELASEVYKKSYEINLGRGEISLALGDLKNYIEAKERTLSELENKLKEEIEIVKGQKQIDLAEKDFALMTKDEDILENQLNTQKIIIGFLSIILLASIVYFYFLFKNIKAKRKANQMLYLKSLRTQMNPHFIFNALNSVNNFIAQNDEKAANKFLSDFSHLMRQVLDYSQKDFIGIQEEIDLNKLYLKLEHFRFRDKFQYTFENDLSDLQKLEVPPMLIQPFIENAVWHGLRYKEDKGELKISFTEANNQLIVLIQDNGIGRQKSRLLKTKNQKKYNSTGLDNVSKRIQLINEIYGKNYSIEVDDLNPDSDDTGTQIKVRIPLN